jgi:polar amino acid transport system substrate-binding protein
MNLISGVAWLAAATVTNGLNADDAITVSLKPIKPFVIVEPQGPTGYSVDLWNAIASKLGIKTRFVVKESVADVLDALKQEDADAAIAAITITAERESEVDFTHPYFKSGLRVAVPSSIAPTWYDTLRRLASGQMLGMLGALLGLTLLTANVLWLLERHVNPECFPAKYLTGVGEAMWWSVATIITGGCENKAPVSLAGRMVAVAWMLGSIVLVASFTATLSSQMTAESVAGAIGGPDGLPGRTVATVAGTAVVDDLRAINARVIECQTLKDAFRAVETARAEAVVFDAPVLAYEIYAAERCPVRLVGPMFEQQDYGIALPKGSPLRKRVNLALLELHETGTLADLNRKWFGTAE